MVGGCGNSTISDIVKGNYTFHSTNHGKPVHKKILKSKSLEVMVYYWNDPDDSEMSGWWFGPAVGGEQVWAYHPALTSGNTEMPPESDWNVPHDGPVDPTFTLTHASKGVSGPANTGDVAERPDAVDSAGSPPPQKSRGKRDRGPDRGADRGAKDEDRKRRRRRKKDDDSESDRSEAEGDESPPKKSKSDKEKDEEKEKDRDKDKDEKKREKTSADNKKYNPQNMRKQIDDMRRDFAKKMEDIQRRAEERKKTEEEVRKRIENMEEFPPNDEDESGSESDRKHVEKDASFQDGVNLEGRDDVKDDERNKQDEGVEEKRLQQKRVDEELRKKKEEEEEEQEQERKRQEQERKLEQERKKREKLEEERKREEERKKKQQEGRKAREEREAREREEVENRQAEEAKRELEAERRRRDEMRAKIGQEGVIRKQQQSVMSVLVALYRLASALPENYESMRLLFERTLESELPRTGNMQGVLKEEIARVEWHAGKYVERLHQQRAAFAAWQAKQSYATSVRVEDATFPVPLPSTSTC